MAKILVIEGEERLCMAIAAYLKSQGADPLTMTTVQDAMRALDTSEVDLVVLDLGLLDGHGLDLLRYIRRSPALADLPIILMTAWEVEPVSYDYLEPGDFLIKPFDMRMLAWMIRQLLSLPQDQDLSVSRLPVSGSPH